MQEDWLAQCADQDVGEQRRKVRGKELVAAGGEFGAGPPAVLDEAGFLIGSVFRLHGRHDAGDAGEVDALAPVVLTAQVAEAGLAVCSAPSFPDSGFVVTIDGTCSSSDSW